MALLFSTPPFRIETEDLYHAALRDFVVNFLKYVVSLRMAALGWFYTTLRYNELDVSVYSCF
jgi:hypothetical protein